MKMKVFETFQGSKFQCGTHLLHMHTDNKLYKQRNKEKKL